MIPHDILTLYAAKAVEYLIAFAFLAAFIPFWRYAMGEARPLPRVATQPARPVARPEAVPSLVEWFRLSRDLAYHRGHSWTRPVADDLVAVGVDDFAQKLVGPLHSVELPDPGQTVLQGERAFRLRVNGKAVDVLSPVDGLVTEINPIVTETPAVLATDPYVTGWLFKVRAPRFEANQKNLLSGPLAEKWLQHETDALRRRLTTDLGLVMQDGGTPVDGLAQVIGGENWDRIAREFLLT